MWTRRPWDLINTDTFSQVEAAWEHLHLHLHILKTHVVLKLPGSEELELTLGFPIITLHLFSWRFYPERLTRSAIQRCGFNLKRQVH